MTIDARLTIRRKAFCLDVDLQLPESGITAVFGPSGCGKTTLLRALAGLDHGDAGYLKVTDQVWQDGPFFVPTHKRAIGYVFQEASLFAHLNVRKNLEYGLRRLKIEERRVPLNDAIELLGIADLLQRRPDNLSGGERQRIAIARALAVSPQLLLMDEPLAALDLERKREILPYLESLHAELDIPIIYVSHSVGEIARLADHLVLLQDGKALASTDAIEAFSRTDLPLALSDKAAAIVEATVEGHDDRFDLSRLSFSGGQFYITGHHLPIGSITRLRVVARDVSLTLQRQTDTSILNIFAGTVQQLVPQGDAQVLVRLSVGGTPMLARLTRKSASALDLQIGKAVFAQVKSVSLLS